jgi:MFS family permease
VDPPIPKPPGLGPIFRILFLVIFGFSLGLPCLAADARDTFGTSELTGTLLASIYSLMQFLFVPVWGRVSDRVGRRRVLLWSVAATCFGMTALGLGLLRASSVVWLFAARAWSGIATANLGTASAYIADVTKPEDRAKGMGLIGMAFGFGFILGPAIGGGLSKIRIDGRGGAVPCFVAAALSLVNLVWTYRALRESLPSDRRTTGAVKWQAFLPLHLDAARSAFARPGIARGVVVNFAITISFTVLDQTFRFLTEDRFQMDALGTGLVLMFVGVVAAGVQGGLIRPLSKKYDDVPILRSGAALQVLAFVGIAVSPAIGRGALYAACAVLALGNGMTQPTVGAFISKRADPRAQGATLGTNQAAAALARMFGPAIGGAFYGAYGPSAPFIAGAVGMAVATAIALGMRPLARPQVS